MDSPHHSGRNTRGGRPPSVTSHTSERAPQPTISTTPATRPTTVDPSALSIIAEVRYMRDGLEARLDGFDERLGAMERWQRQQEFAEDERANDTDPPGRQHSVAVEEQHKPESNSEEIGVTNFGLQTPAYVNTRRRDRAPPPHLRPHQLSDQHHQEPHTPRTLGFNTTTIPARELQASSFTTPTAGGLSPLERFQLLDGQGRRKVRRTMRKLGLQVPEFMGIIDADQDNDVDDTTGEHSSESPLRSRDTGNQDGVLRLDSSPVENTPIAIVPPPAIAPAPNIRHGQPPACRQEMIGLYHGDPYRLDALLSRIRDVLRSDGDNPVWVASVMRTIPIALRGNAAKWHEGLSDAQAKELRSFEAWSTAMHKSFKVNTTLQRKQARDRHWVPAQEYVAEYYFDKLRALRQAFGYDQPDDKLVGEIKDGFPPSFVTMLRLLRDQPTLEDLVEEMGEYEPHWRSIHHIPPPPDPDTTHTTALVAPVPALPSALSRLQSQAMVRSASAPALPAVRQLTATAAPASRATPPVSSGMSPMAAAYDPSRVIPAANREVRKYRVEGRPTPMRLDRPCGKCGGDHFNFEHVHLVPQVRLLEVDADDDYPFEEGIGPSAYAAQPANHGEMEEGRNTPENVYSFSSMENGLAPSMSNSHGQVTSAHDDSTALPVSTSDEQGTLFLVNRPILSTPRTLRPNESVPALSQPKRAFGNVVALPRQVAAGTGQGYRSHIPLTTHIRVNDTDGRALSTLVDTGATLSCIDASLLQRMGGRPSGPPMKIQGIGSSQTLGWATLPVFLHATDRHGLHVHLEFHQDFHVLPAFPPGLCLGLDFIVGYDVSLSPTRGRGRIGQYTFPVHEKLAGPYAKDAELCAAVDVVVPAGFQAWVPVDASCLAPGVDYTITPRLSVTPDETVRLTGPVGLLNHGTRQHVLLGNYGSSSFMIERGTIIADAVGARIGDLQSPSAQVFTAGVPDSTPLPPPMPNIAEDSDDAALPIDVFDGIDVAEGTLTQDAVTVLVDDSFRVGITSDGQPHASVVELLRSFQDAFALDGRPGRIEDHDMTINLLPDAVLPPEPPRRASPEKRAAMDAAIEQLLDWEVIEPSQSPVSFPVVMIKQNGKWRFCVDYRQLNSKTVPDRYPLPTIDAIFQTLTGKKWFSSLDAIRGYHQLGVAAEDRWKTAFVCHRGLYQYKRVPFGLRNAPAIFQRLMDKVLGSLRWQQAVVYIDDAVIATDTLEAHNSALATLLQNAMSVGLEFSPAKCTFAVPSLTLLGRKVSGAGVAIWADRAQAVQVLARPTTLQELYHALGLFGYYRAFIHKFAEKAAPLTRLLKGWKYDFEALRAAVANPPVLAHPDPSRPYILYTDASKDALAAILHQVSTAHTPVVVSDAAARVNTLSVPDLPSDFARERWNAWLCEDRHFGPILRSIRSDPASVPDWVVREDVLVRRSDDRVALPAAGLSTVLKRIHDEGGHFGFWKTFLAVSRHFWRPQLSTSVRAWVKHCDRCRQTKTAPKTGVLDISQDPTLPFDHVSIDLIYGFPRSRSGNDAALVVQDLFSRMILLAPCTKEITAEGVAAILSDRVLRFGWRPRRIVSDSEARVSGSIMSQLCASLGAVGTPSSPYHQQANSVERAVQTVQRVLQVLALDSKAHWDRRLLPAVELAMNGSPSTVTGQRPFDLVFLSHPPVVHAVFDADEHLGVSSFSERLADAQERLEEARRHIAVARTEQKRRFDHRRAQPSLIVPGMRAWIRLRDRPVAGASEDKLDAQKLGPFPILEVISAHRVRLDLPDDMGIDPVLSIEQLDLEPLADDPFAADRLVPSAHPRSPFALDAAASARRTRSPDPNSIGSGDEEAAVPSLPPRARRPPLGLQDFQVGTIKASPSAALQDMLHGPLFKPHTLQEGDTLLTLTERPVAFISRLTSVAECKLVAAELELVCLAWAYQKFSHLLEGVICTVVTDHAPMERMLRSTSSIAYGPIITRCRAILMPHLANLRFVYRPGPRHTNVDALSRLPITTVDQGRPTLLGGDVLAGSQ